MKKFIAMALISATLIITTATAFAAATNPAELVAEITGQTVENVIKQSMETRKSFRTIADDAGKLDEYNNGLLDMKKASIQKDVDAGYITQTRADEIYNIIEENQNLNNGNNYGYGYGHGCGHGGYGGYGYGGGCGRW